MISQPADFATQLYGLATVLAHEMVLIAHQYVRLFSMVSHEDSKSSIKIIKLRIMLVRKLNTKSICVINAVLLGG